MYVDSVILQTLHDYPRWKSEDVLLQYKPLGWDSIYEEFRDDDGYYNGVYVLNWSNVWNTEHASTAGITDYDDFLKPEFTNKLVLTYPNDDVRFKSLRIPSYIPTHSSFTGRRSIRI